MNDVALNRQHRRDHGISIECFHKERGRREGVPTLYVSTNLLEEQIRLHRTQVLVNANLDVQRTAFFEQHGYEQLDCLDLV